MNGHWSLPAMTCPACAVRRGPHIYQPPCGGAGQRAVIVTNNDDAYRTALALHDAGAHVIIADLRHRQRPLITAATAAGIEIMPGHAVINAVGNLRVGRVEIAPVNADATTITGDIIHRDCTLSRCQAVFHQPFTCIRRPVANCNGMIKSCALNHQPHMSQVRISVLGMVVLI